MSNSSNKRQNIGENTPSTRKKVATSLSSDSVVPPKGIGYQTINEYPSVVPRSVWVVSNAKSSKKQKVEYFAATLLYHRSYIPLQNQSDSGNSARV